MCSEELVRSVERVVDGARRDVVVRLVEWVEAGSVAELSKRVDLRVSVPLGGAFMISTTYVVQSTYYLVRT